ncbi:zf-HC2 domain-containing protein [Candidatus Poribacteria bacterium]|nr:zf-HC2 domain-containing protein [Candidatus Poribacteria bacterium]
MNCKQTRENLVLHRQDSMLQGTKRHEFLQHLRGCKACQVEYEGLWHTATVLGSLEAPEPPPELLGNIQGQIREVHRRNQTAFFAAPISWLFGKFKLEISPQFVNCVALLCYLIVSVFFVKLVFFTDTPEQDFGLTAMEETRLQRVRIAPSPWASLKHGSAQVEKTLPTEAPKKTHVNLASPFADIESTELWHTHPINKGTEVFDAHFSNTVSKKLTVIWSDIKTNL